MSLPRGQQWLISRMKQLGYASDDRGICFGVAHMGLQAILAEELDVFDNRLKTIYSISLNKIAQKIDDLKKQRKQTKGLPIHPLLEIPAFFEGVELYHHIYLYPFLFEKQNQPHNQNAMATASLILPNVLKENNLEIDKLTTFTGAYTEEDLIDYFDSLRSTIRKNHPGLLKPFTMILSSASHTITVAYDPKKDEWLLIDANTLPTQHIAGSKNIIAEKVLSTFPKNGITNFITHIYTTNTNKTAVEACVNDWKNQEVWKKIHAVSVDKATHSSWLFIASQEGDLDTVNELLDAQADVNCARTDGTTSLFIAAQNGHIEVVKRLIAKGANANIANHQHSTALLIATQIGHAEIVKALLDAHADVDFARTDGATALLHACELGHFKVVEALIAAHVNVDLACTDNGATALYIAACYGYLNIVNALIAAHANVDIARTDDGTTALYIAAQHGYLRIVKALLAAHADVNCTLDDGTTALYIAAQKGYTEIVKLLLAAGAKVDLTRTDGSTVLMIAAQTGRFEIVQTLLAKKAKVDLTLDDGTTALYFAAQHGRFKIVQALLAENANINLACTDGTTALFAAAKNGHFDIVRLLLSKGANIDVALQNDSESLRELAKEYNVESRMNALIKKKRCPSTISITIEEIALVMGHTEIADYLKYKKELSLQKNKNDARYKALKYHFKNHDDDQQALINFKKLDEIALSLRNIAHTYRSKTIFHAENKKRKISIDNILMATNDAYNAYISGVEIDQIVSTLITIAEKISLDTKKDHHKVSPIKSIFFTNSRLAEKINAVVLPLNQSNPIKTCG